MTEKVLGSLQIDFVLSLFGALDSHTDTIEKAFNVRIAAGENGIVITGENADNVQMAATVIEQLERISSVNGNIDINTVNYVVSMVSERKQDELSAIYNDCICLTSRSSRKPSASRIMWTGSKRTRSCSASVPQAPAKPFWP